MATKKIFCHIAFLLISATIHGNNTQHTLRAASHPDHIKGWFSAEKEIEELLRLEKIPPYSQNNKQASTLIWRPISH